MNSSIITIPIDKKRSLELQVGQPDSKGVVALHLTDGDSINTIDKIDIAKSTARRRFVKSAVGGEVESVADAVERTLVDVATQHLQSKGRDPTDDPSVRPEIPEGVKADALTMLRDPQLIYHIADDIAALGVAGEATLAVTIYLVGTSRLLHQPLAAIVQGLSPSGKSFINFTVAKLFPDSCVLLANKITPEALAHMPAGSLTHRFIVGGERSRCQDDKAADAKSR